MEHAFATSFTSALAFSGIALRHSASSFSRLEAKQVFLPLTFVFVFDPSVTLFCCYRTGKDPSTLEGNGSDEEKKNEGAGRNGRAYKKRDLTRTELPKITLQWCFTKTKMSSTQLTHILTSILTAGGLTAGPCYIFLHLWRSVSHSLFSLILQ